MDNLTEFCNWWLKSKIFRPPQDIYMRVAGNTGLTVFRDGKNQVQLFICDPGIEITDHIHPRVDSYEVYVGGDVWFRHQGRQIPPEIPGMRIRVKPNDWHGATIGPRGGSFLSIQEWLNNDPTSVHLDWEGPPLDESHNTVLNAR